MLVAVVAVLAIGGRPDPAGPALVLDGAWRFHPGDDPSWADPRTDDRKWDRIDLISKPDNRDGDVGLPGYLPGWRARGHPDLEGYGWYRRRVALPPQGDLVLLGPTMVNDGYEMFWNGRPLGGIGRIGHDPRIVGVRPFLTKVPRSAGEHDGVLAIRTFMLPGYARDSQSGGLRSVPTLAESSFGHELYRAQWLRTIAGYIAEAALPIMMFLLAGIALVAAPSTARPRFARWLAVALVATAFLRLGNAIASWTDLMGVITLGRLNAYLWSPLAMLSWTAAWNEWTDGRERRLALLAAFGAWAMRIVAVAAHVHALDSIGRYVSIVLFVLIAARIIRFGERKLPALATMSVVAIALFINEISRLGVPDIWFPFNIGVTLTQYAYALSLPLLAFALVATDENDVAAKQATVDESRPSPA
jgi:hypothetical protein